MNSEGGYTVDPGFRMPAVSEPPTEPATPVVPSYDTPDSPKPSGFLVPMPSLVEQSKALGKYLNGLKTNKPEVVVGIDPGSPSYMVMGYREGDKVTIVQEGRFVIQGVIGGTLDDGVQYKVVRDFDESHIVRGYD